MEELLSPFVLIVGATVTALAGILHLYIYVKRRSPASKIPGEDGNFYIGKLKDVATNQDHIGALQLRWLQKHPDTPLLRYNFVLGDIKVIVTDPDLIKHVLITNGSNYNKNLPAYHMVKKYFLGNGLVALDGAAHAHHRGLINDAFSYKYLKNFVSVFSGQTKKLTDLWDAKENGELVNVQVDLCSLGLSIIGLTSFGFDFDTLSKEEDRDSNARDLARKFLWSITARAPILALIFPIFNSLPVPSNRMREKRRDALDYGVENVIRAKREYLKNADAETLSKPRDLLEIIINLKDENGQTLSTSDLIDEAKTFILAGFETTATAMNFTLYLLALHPEHADIIKNEVDAVLGDRELVEPEDIEKFKYLNMCIKESMRLFPPVPAVSRHCVETETLAGYTIPKGTAVNVVPFLMHHHPKYWNEPEKFDPLRWTPEEVAKRNPYLYFPFLLGARNCIGQKFGMMEVKAVLAMIVRKYEFTIPLGYKMVPKSFISLHAFPELQMYIRHRNK